MEFEEEEISEEEYESLLREEIEEKIRIMNEQGPNN
jgi:methionine synthase II (cobalamin-independent)